MPIADIDTLPHEIIQKKWNCPAAFQVQQKHGVSNRQKNIERIYKRVKLNTLAVHTGNFLFYKLCF